MDTQWRRPVIDEEALKAELRDIDQEIADTKQKIQDNNRAIRLKFNNEPGDVTRALLDNTPHFDRYDELRDLRERLLLSLGGK